MHLSAATAKSRTSYLLKRKVHPKSIKTDKKYKSICSQRKAAKVQVPPTVEKGYQVKEKKRKQNV